MAEVPMFIQRTFVSRPDLQPYLFLLNDFFDVHYKQMEGHQDNDENVCRLTQLILHILKSITQGGSDVLLIFDEAHNLKKCDWKLLKSVSLKIFSGGLKRVGIVIGTRPMLHD